MHFTWSLLKVTLELIARSSLIIESHEWVLVQMVAWEFQSCFELGAYYDNSTLLRDGRGVRSSLCLFRGGGS
jgi:hypothetical protein